MSKLIAIVDACVECSTWFRVRAPVWWHSEDGIMYVVTNHRTALCL